MDRYKCMKMPISLFPEHIIQKYDLKSKVKNGFIYMEIRESFVSYRKQACSQINIWKRNWHFTDIMRYPTLLVYGNTYPAL